VNPIFHYYNSDEIEPEREQYIQPLSDSCKELISTAFETYIPPTEITLVGGYHNYGSFGLTFSYTGKHIRVEGVTDAEGRVDLASPDVYWEADDDDADEV